MWFTWYCCPSWAPGGTYSPNLVNQNTPERAEARRTIILQPVEQKPHSQKDRQNEKAETMYQMKEHEKPQKNN